MTFLEALYGSQYAEIKQNGKDGQKGRLNGTVFLTAMVIMFIVVVFLALSIFIPLVSRSLGSAIKGVFGELSGRAIGKILGLISFALIYFIINKTIGTQDNFNRLVDNYQQYPESTRAKATKVLLIPFFALLVLLFILGFLI